jgi:hypothetical protein
MIKDLDFDKLENPYVQVVWEDAPENFTQEKLKNVKHTSKRSITQQV